MAIIHAQKQLVSGNHLLLIEVAGRGGGDFYRPKHLKLIELSNADYKSSSAKNVVDVHSEMEFNGSSTRGPRSRFGSILEELKEEFETLH